MSEVCKKGCKATGKWEDSKRPCSAELEKFLTKSRKCQTLYSNCEGYDASRIFQFHDRNLIEEFVAYTMFFKRCCKARALNLDEDEIVKNITERMIKESQKYNCKVHISVILVYYFVYNDEKTEFLPVFKIYKYCGHQAIYLDTFLKVYQSWDCYLDDPGLGESLLCVPRRGEYHYDGLELNLEYILSKGTHSGFTSNISLSVKNIAPSSLAALWAWVRKIQSWLSNYPVMLEAVNKFLNFCKENGQTIFNVSVAVLSAYLEFGHGIESAFLVYCWQAAQIMLMFIDSEEVSGDWSCLKMLESKIQKAITIQRNAYQEVRKLLVLLSKSSKDWFEIVSTLCCLIQKCNDVYCQSTPGIKAAQRQNFTEDDRMIAQDKEVQYVFGRSSLQTN